MSTTAASARVGSSVSELGSICKAWAPLAMSWLLVMVELPLVSAFLGRFAEPERNLAAFGGVVFPLVLVASSPVIMLLSAATALARDRESYRVLRRFAHLAGAALTVLYVAVVWTPLYRVIVAGAIPPPSPILELAGLGLMVVTPYVWLVAWRRTAGGVLIRSGQSTRIGAATTLRLAAVLATLAGGAWLEVGPGVVVGAAALVLGVASEALYLNFHAWRVARRLPRAPRAADVLTWPRFARFYSPLAATAVLSLAVQPLTSAAIARMPHVTESLAVWAVVNGLLSIFAAPGFAYQEAVVALSGRPAARAALARFAALMAGSVTLLLAVVAVSPLGTWLFARVWGLTPAYAGLASAALWLGLLIPALTAGQSLFQGRLVHERRTRVVTEGIVLYLLVAAAIFAGGVAGGSVPGVHVALGGLTLALLARDAWLWHRSR